MLQKQIIGYCYLLFCLLGFFLLPYFWVSYRDLVVTLDEKNGIDLRIGRRRRQVPWKEVASFNYRSSKYVPHSLYVLGEEDGGGLITTPILLIPPFVDCTMIAKCLEEIGIPKES
jgi:hypothetical protein